MYHFLQNLHDKYPHHQCKNNGVHYSLFIVGPTASGKTALSIQLADALQQKFSFIGAQIINADIGQFYTPLSVGVAKPDWQNMFVPHHLFDVLSQPEDLNVVTYRKMLLDKVAQIWNEGYLPIIVGGSLFYIQSLFFPPSAGGIIPHEYESCAKGTIELLENDESLWKQLYAIDPVRAKALHPNDIYRIKRALDVWEKTGKKPSLLAPECVPPFHSRIIFIDLPREILYQRINLRTEQMIKKNGWIHEAKQLQNTKWEKFLKRKKLIGYSEIFEWLENGEIEDQMPTLITNIQQKTRHYAKRQITFWKKFRTILSDYEKQSDHTKKPYLCSTETIKNVDNKEIRAILERVGGDIAKITN